MTAAQAAWRPNPGRHNSWEIAGHCAYWKYAVRRRLSAEPRGRFALTGSNWFESPRSAGQSEWRSAIRLLADEHKKLRMVVAGGPAHTLDQPADGGTTSRVALIRGAAAHDLYHAGQIQLLKKLLADAS